MPPTSPSCCASRPGRWSSSTSTSWAPASRPRGPSGPTTPRRVGSTRSPSAVLHARKRRKDDQLVDLTASPRLPEHLRVEAVDTRVLVYDPNGGMIVEL